MIEIDATQFLRDQHGTHSPHQSKHATPSPPQDQHVKSPPLQDEDVILPQIQDQHTPPFIQDQQTFPHQVHHHATLEDAHDIEISTMASVVYGPSLAHTIPGILFITGALTYLLVVLKRARKLHPGQSYCDLYVPEKNYKFLARFAQVFVVLIVLATIRQLLAACHNHNEEHCILNQIGHVSMYMTYAGAAVVILLESTGRIPIDTWRYAISLCFLLNYLLVSGHAELKSIDTNALTHRLWGLIEFSHAIIWSYSIYNTSSMIAYVASLSMFLLKGSWIITTGLQIESGFMSLENIRPMFVFQTITIAFSVTMVSAFFGNVNYKYNSQQDRLRTKPNTRNYEQLNLSCDDDTPGFEGSTTA